MRKSKLVELNSDTIETNQGSKILVYTRLHDMKGLGEEWLVDAITGNVRAVFIDGDMACQILYLPQGNRSDTKIG